MSNASRDNNGVPTLLAISSVDGATVIPVRADPTLHRLLASDATGGTNLGPSRALRDQNGIPTLMAISSTDGITPVPIYSDSNGNLLINSQ